MQPTRVADASNRTAPVQTTGVGATSTTLKPTTPPDDLWLRALVLAPNLQNYLTATVMGQADMRELVPLMDKPDAVVTMAFGDNPNLGLSHRPLHRRRGGVRSDDDLREEADRGAAVSALGRQSLA